MPKTKAKYEKGYVLDERLRQLMHARGETPADVARAISTSRQSVYAWRDRKARPEPQWLIALSEHFGVSVSSLLYGQATFDRDVLGRAIQAAFIAANVERPISARRLATIVTMLYEAAFDGRVDQAMANQLVQLARDA